MSTIVIKDWYQLDFKMISPIVDLKKIDTVMEELAKEGLASKWFFLFEQGPVIRVRVRSSSKDELHKKLDELSSSCGLEPADSLPFSEYAENSEDWSHPDEEVFIRFANIMCEVTQLTIKKINRENQFNTYRVIERINHCIFDIMATLSMKSEEYFLVQRFKERTKLPFDGDFENKIVEQKKE